MNLIVRYHVPGWESELIVGNTIKRLVNAGKSKKEDTRPTLQDLSKAIKDSSFDIQEKELYEILTKMEENGNVVSGQRRIQATGYGISALRTVYDTK
jgi:polyhydroxyalkanoate synthesis regulator phasin